MTVGFKFLPGYLSGIEQGELVTQVRQVVAKAPLFQPVMPRTGKPFSVRMSNAGPLGWVSDKDGGYRYQPEHPVTGKPWPPLPEVCSRIWQKLLPDEPEPECCLINFYNTKARMGLHVDKDEEALEVPVLSISLGDTGVFRIGGRERKGKTESVKLSSGDIVILAGEARMAFHGIDRILPGSSNLLSGDGRLNLTLRRVTSA